MSTQHTPGPWNFYTEPQPNGCPIVGSRGLMVAMLAHTVNQDDQRETALANARLISAAPDLLKALQYMLAVCPAINHQGEEAHQQAGAAIAKAGGLHGQC